MGVRVDGPSGRRFLSLTAAMPLRVVEGAFGAVGIGIGAVVACIPVG